MRKHFFVNAAIMLPNGKVIVAGSTLGTPLPSPGERGKVITPTEIEIEVNSIPILDPSPQDPNKRALQLTVLSGDYRGLEGATINFEDF